MVARLQELAAEESDEFRKRQWLHNVESLARQLKNAHPCLRRHGLLHGRKYRPLPVWTLPVFTWSAATN